MFGLFVNYDDKTFGDCGNSNCCNPLPKNKQYNSVFGVGDLRETMIWACVARPLKLSENAINYYNVKEIGDMKGKIIGVVRRIEKNGVKIDEYHCPKYILKEITYQYNWQMSYATIICMETGEEEDVTISRVCVPIMEEKNDVFDT